MPAACLDGGSRRTDSSIIKIRIMKHRLLLVVFAALMIPAAVSADSYTTLWKREAEAREKDLPKTRIDILDRIIAKAEADKAYGQLLKAQVTRIGVSATVSPDSLAPAVSRLEAEAKRVESVDVVLAAVYNSVLGTVYRERPSLSDDAAARSEAFYDLSLRHPDRLAHAFATGYAPFIEDGVDSRIFGDDVLHVLGMEAGRYAFLHDYYEKAGNRAATCLCALKMVQQNREGTTLKMQKSAYLQSIDSLIDKYGDLDVAGELAIERYNFMEASEDATPEDKMNYIDYALVKWGAWQRMNVLRNAVKRLTMPYFNVTLGDKLALPGRPKKVTVASLCNIGQLTMTVRRVNVKGDDDINPSDPDDYARLKKLIVPGETFTRTRRYIGMPPYKVVSDSMQIDGLKNGVYLVEFTTDNTNVPVERTLLYVSNLMLVSEAMPGNNVRMVVVNATTGEPVPGARIRVTSTERRYSDNKGVETLTCNDAGEALFNCRPDFRHSYYIYTDGDTAFPESSFGGYFSYNDNRRKMNYVSLYTDRRIYRPGQTVHLAAIAYSHDSETKRSAAIGGRAMTLTLRDANYKEVAKRKVVTDSFGMASADFVLPASCLPGNFSVRCDFGSNGITSFSVEEYKRPTFDVQFDKLTSGYSSGDTVTVKGYAKTYAGVPVQGARVVYTVTRRPSMLWRYYGGGDATVQILSDTIATGSDGKFSIKVPVALPETMDERPNRYYSFGVLAVVTDMAGETHDGETSIPLSDRPTSLTCDMPARVERDSLKTVTFFYRNNAGEMIDGDVTFYIDSEKYTCKANVPAAISSSQLRSMRHTLRAYCGNDTIEREFVVFTMQDRKAVVETHDWFYASAEEFGADGRPVYVQLGSSDSLLHVFYTVLAGDRILENGTMTLRDELHTRELTYKPEYGDGVLLNYAWVKDGRLYRHSVTLTRPKKDTRLMMKWTTFRDRLTPGQKEEWTLSVSRPDGTPADAQLMATLYDKSLDALRRNWWRLSMPLYYSVPFTSWSARYATNIGVYGEMPLKLLDERGLDFGHYDVTPLLGIVAVNEVLMAKGEVLRSKEMIAQPMSASDEVMSVGYARAVEDASGGKLSLTGATTPVTLEADSEQTPQMRENFNETAFFYPGLTTDEKGNISIKFTLPESITTWKFMGIAHDKNMNSGMLEGEAVAQKTVMVQPNVPRFVRKGDKVSISARLFNTSEKDVTGTARLALLNPENEKEVWHQTVKYAVKKGETAAVSFSFDMDKVENDGLLICRVTASGRGYSDGEQHYMAVMPDRELVTNTKAFTWDGAGERTIDLRQMFAEDNDDNRLTVEYTDNPSWLILQTLPVITETCEDNALCLAAAYYANGLGRNIIKSVPDFKRVLDLWGQEKGEETSLMSNLQKNEELKSVVLSETPWLMEARTEADRKRMLTGFYDESALEYRLNDVLAKLRKLQNGDGSFSWWQGMSGSVYMTSAVAGMLVRLNAMTGADPATAGMLKAAIDFLGKNVATEVESLKKAESKGEKNLRPSEMAVTYLYICALDGRELDGQRKKDYDYLVNLLERESAGLTIAGKANIALIMSGSGRGEKAAELLRSVKEYSVFSDEMGRYFDTPKAFYSWYDYRIPTQTAVIEALQAVTPEDVTTIREMQRWLLQSKRTQGWDTPLNNVDAVYAFMKGNADAVTLSEKSVPVMKVDGSKLELPKSAAGTGYVKATRTGDGMNTLTVGKSSEGTSWGAVYAQFMQNVKDVDGASEGLTVKREILKDGKVLADGAALYVGDRIKVRITVNAARDYDFVQLTDKRAACMEPALQISGYHRGCYYAQGDNRTGYYFDRMAKGKHVIETEYYVDRAGTYSTGTCTVQCAYSPEYSARSAAMTVNVSERK